MKRPEEVITGIPQELKEKNGASTRRKRSCIKDLMEACKKQQDEVQEQPNEEQRKVSGDN